MSSVPAILLVDDEAPLLRLMQTFLERSGYRVEAFSTAAAALDRSRPDPTAFRVAIVDLSLGGMPGNELGLALLRLNPDIRVLVCSGYPFDLESLPEPARPSFAHLQKPFAPKMLVSSVESLLAR